jgi:short-subunit dehydrogenase
MKEYTLITGASDGIGKVFAEAFARRGGPLILVARSKDKLDAVAAQLSSQYKVDVQVVAQDLSVPGAAAELFKACRKFKVKTLVNNAGFGLLGAFSEQDPHRVSQMIALNIGALTELTHLFLAQIKEAQGAILNVASTAAFQAIPYFAVYAATKAYVLHFSEALHEELKSSHVQVLALCPGPTRTGFFEAAEVKGDSMKLAMETPEQVVQVAMKALDSGQAFVISGVKNKLAAASARLAPRGLVTKIAAKFMGH